MKGSVGAKSFELGRTLFVVRGSWLEQRATYHEKSRSEDRLFHAQERAYFLAASLAASAGAAGAAGAAAVAPAAGAAASLAGSAAAGGGGGGGGAASGAFTGAGGGGGGASLPQPANISVASAAISTERFMFSSLIDRLSLSLARTSSLLPVPSFGLYRLSQRSHRPLCVAETAGRELSQISANRRSMPRLSSSS